MPGPHDHLARVEAAYRRAWVVGSDHGDESLLRELRAEGLRDEWTVVDHPSSEILLASWRAGDDPDKAMELMRVAIRAQRDTP
jgi:hypothetical protein